MIVELYLAYDGSINGDWVARYGIRFSTTLGTRRLNLVHIDDGSVSATTLQERLAHLERECRALEVELAVKQVALQRDVLTTLRTAIPPGKEVLCICGARATSRQKGFLAGTVSQKLLRLHSFNTLALRVVNPGQLGCPAAVMFPLAGHPRRFQAAMPLLHLLSPCLKRLILLRVMHVNPLLFRYLPAASARRLRREGLGYLLAVAEDIAECLGEQLPQLDDHVQISDDWAKEIVIQASKTRAGLVMLGASDRFLQSRFYYGSRIEQILRNSPCDVGIYRII